MNFLAIKNYVREYGQTLFSFNKSSEGKQFNLSDSLLETFINEGYKLFCSYARTVKEQKYISTTALQTVYNLSSAVTTNTSTNASTNLVEVIECFYESATDKWRMRAVKDFERLYWETVNYDSPQAFELQYGNKQIELFPKISSSSENIWIYGVWLPIDLSADTDEPQIPNNYHQALCNYAIFKLQMLIGALDQSKQSAFAQYEKFEQSFINLAEACRKECEFKNNDTFQMREDTEETEFYDDYYYPTFNHNPVITLLRFLTTLTFQDTSTGINRLVVDSTGIYVNGIKLAFLGASGTDNFSGYTGVTTITIPDQGGITYDIFITPKSVGAPTGNIGEITTEIVNATSFKVYNTGDSTGEFSYLVTNS